MNSRNLAARAGKWSAQHRKTAILGWILFVVIATIGGMKVGQQELPSAEMGNGDSERGEMIIDKADFPETVGEQVLVQGKGTVRADSPQVTAAVKDVVQRLERIDGVTDIESPRKAADRANTVSKDGRSVVVNFTLPGHDDEPEALEKAAEAPLAAVAAVQKAHPELTVAEYGAASERKALAATEAADEARQMQFSLIGTLLILLLAFGAIVAAGVPLLLGLSSVAATIGLLGPVSQLSGLHPAVAQVVTLIALAVAVDYAMFYVRRMMEEQDKGRSSEAALEVAAATSGRAVLISGFTVMAAMGGMFFSGNPIFVSFGIGTILVVGVAVLGSLTVLPAMLSYLGQKGWLEKGRVPYVAKRRHRNAGVSRDQPIMQTLDRIDAAFPGASVPAATVIKAKDVTTPEVQAAIAELKDEAIATGKRSEPSFVDISPDKTVAVVGLAVDGKGTDAASEASLEVLREDVVPATVGKLSGAEVAVTGMTAGSKDFLDTMKSHLPIVFLFVLSLAFILLLVTFRSIVVPIKAIILNLLSVGAAYGVLKLVFQDGLG